MALRWKYACGGLDEGYYPTGIKITDQQLADLPIQPHTWHEQWNYTLTPN